MPGFGFWAVKLSAAMLVVFLASLAFPEITAAFRLVSAEISVHPWILVTYMFIHSGWLHIIYNLSGFVVFGSILEKYAGTKKFLVVFFASGIMAGMGGTLFYDSMVGASGAVFGVLGCLAVIRPRQLVIAFGIPVSVIGAVIIYALIDIALIFSPDSVAHASHLFGLATGVIIGLELKTRMPRGQKPPKTTEHPTEKELDEWEEKWMLSSFKESEYLFQCRPPVILQHSHPEYLSRNL